jgi:hypothetical protein
MYKLEDNIKVEITVRNPKNIVFEIPRFLSKHLDGKKKDKVIFMLPGDWIGFKNGFVQELIKSGLDVYFALAYSTTGNEKVTDSEGNNVRPFIHHFPGGIIYKYVKKAFTVVAENGKEYQVELNLYSSEPIMITEKAKICRI